MSESAEKVYEALLVLRCQAGDSLAFAELVEQYDPRLRFFLRKMLGSRGADVDDLLQEVWLAVLRGIRRLVDSKALAGWIYRIARDLAFRELRKRRVPTEELAEHEVDEPQEDIDTDGEFTEEEAAAVNSAIDQLTPEHREALLLRFLEGMDYEQISAAVGCSVGTVRSRLHYAKMRVRALIGDMATAGKSK